MGRFGTGRRQALWVLWAAAVLLGPSALFGQTPDWVKKERKKEVRSSDINWYDANAYRGEDETDTQVREKAKTKALRMAAERMQVFVESKTVLKNELVEKSQIRTSTGLIGMRILKRKACAYDDPNQPRRTHCRFQIEVYFVSKPKRWAQDLNDPNARLTVRFSSDKRVYRKGEEIVLRVVANKPAHVRIVTVNPDGKVIQLFPNQYRRDNFLREGRKKYRIPDEQYDRYRLQVTHPPYGRERFVLYASTEKLPDISLTLLAQGLGRYGGTRDELDIKTRDVGIVPAPAPTAPRPGAAAGPGGPAGGPAEFFESEIEVETRP
jgi:hypothetical protein